MSSICSLSKMKSDVIYHFTLANEIQVSLLNSLWPWIVAQENIQIDYDA